MSKKKKKKVISPLRRKIRLVLKVTWLVLLVGILLAVGIFYFKYGKNIVTLKEEAVEMVQTSTEDTFKMNQTSLVYDKDGNVISKLKGEKDVYYLNYEEIPDNAKQAMISIEDKNFTTHKGVDLKANIRAMISLFRNKGNIKQGASTITQQLSRNIFLSHEVSYERKLKEIFIALELEKKYPKYKILEFYLNNIYFANGYYGIQAASYGYFSKSVNDLSLSQITYLCAIPNNPTLYNPLTKPENVIKRRDRILTQMFNDGAITEEQLEEAKAETITLNISTIEKQNYVDSYVKLCAIEALMEVQGFKFQNEFKSQEEKDLYEQSYEEVYAKSQLQLFNKGYSIYTSIDTEKQKELQDALDKTLSKFTEIGEDGIYEMQGASVSIDNATGRVVAMVGGRTQDSIGYLNRAYQAYRQPGSAIKPLIVYTPALQKGYSPYTVVVDEPIEGGPSNSTGKYLGQVTLTTAVAKSINTVAHNVFKDITPKYGVNFLYKMGFSKLVNEKNELSAALGGFTNGVSPLEMAAGYATIENDGVYRKPTCIIRIVDSSGVEVVKDEVEERVVYEKNASRAMTDMLTNVFKTGGTAAGKGINNMSSAGKTGTTNNTKDGWFVGYTPYYTTSVWVGYDMPKSVSSLKGNTYPLSIWNEYMTTIHKGLKNKEFPVYSGYAPAPTPVVEETIAPEETEEPIVEATEEPAVEEDVKENEEIKATPTPTQVPTVTPTPVPTKAPPTKTPPTVEPTQEPTKTPSDTTVEAPAESKPEPSSDVQHENKLD